VLLCWIYQSFAIFYFYILQGSVATLWMYGGKHDNDFIANSSPNPNVKEF